MAPKDTSPDIQFSKVPPKEALSYFERKGLKVGFNSKKVWQQEHALSFTIAKVTKLSILKDVKASLEKSMKEGTPFREWAKDAEDILSKTGWANYNTEQPQLNRLKIIFDTNMRMASACGQWQRVERTKEDLPYLIYELGPSKNHDRDPVPHTEWEGVILPVDDPWWETHYPPSAWGCKCWVRQISRSEAEALGGVSEEAPPSYDVPWENEITGETGEAPVGVDPAFAYPKGERDSGINQALEDLEREME